MIYSYTDPNVLSSWKGVWLDGYSYVYPNNPISIHTCIDNSYLFQGIIYYWDGTGEYPYLFISGKLGFNPPPDSGVYTYELGIGYPLNEPGICKGLRTDYTLDLQSGYAYISNIIPGSNVLITWNYPTPVNLIITNYYNASVVLTMNNVLSPAPVLFIVPPNAINPSYYYDDYYVEIFDANNGGFVASGWIDPYYGFSPELRVRIYSYSNSLQIQCGNSGFYFDFISDTTTPVMCGNLFEQWGGSWLLNYDTYSAIYMFNVINQNQLVSSLGIVSDANYSPQRLYYQTSYLIDGASVNITYSNYFDAFASLSVTFIDKDSFSGKLNLLNIEYDVYGSLVTGSPPKLSFPSPRLPFVGVWIEQQYGSQLTLCADNNTSLGPWSVKGFFYLGLAEITGYIAFDQNWGRYYFYSNYTDPITLDVVSGQLYFDYYYDNNFQTIIFFPLLTILLVILLLYIHEITLIVLHFEPLPL